MKYSGDVLRRAVSLITETGWSDGASARDQDGVPVDPTSSEAQSFDAVGALRRASHDLEADELAFDLALDYLSMEADCYVEEGSPSLIGFLTVWSAVTPKAEVLAAFERAIGCPRPILAR